MGCAPSKPAQHPARGQARPPNRPVELHRMEAHRPQTHPERTERELSAQIRAEFLAAVDAALGSIEYGIIGGAALAEYGHTRVTSDVDVIVPHNVSNIVEGQLLSRGMVRTARGGIGYIASDGRCYGLDITTDRDVSQTFRASSNAHRMGRSRARIANIDYLLNSKGYAYLTRIGSDRQAKMAIDADDVLFILGYMQRNRIPANSKACRWIIDYDFWTMFCSNYQGTEHALQALGLHRDATPSSSNRASRDTSMSRHSRTSSGSGSRGSRRH